MSNYPISGGAIFQAMSADPDFDYLIVDLTIMRARTSAQAAQRGTRNLAIGCLRDLTTKIHLAVGGLAQVVAELNKQPASRGGVWRVERLKRAVRRLVDEHLAGAELLGRAPRRPVNPGLAQTVTAMRRANPGITLREIGRQLEAMGVRPPRGHARWSAAMVASLLQPPAAAV